MEPEVEWIWRCNELAVQVFDSWAAKADLGITLPMVLRMQKVAPADWPDLIDDINTIYQAYRSCKT